MPDFYSLTCPICGGKLLITKDIDRFACAYCGTEHLVKRGGGVISLSPIVEAIDRVGSGVDKTASELALVRLHKEIDELQNHKQEIVLQNPKPGGLGCASSLIILGVIIGFLNIVTGNLGSSTGVFVVGFMLAFVGFFISQDSRSKQEEWEKWYEEQIKEINFDIAKKQSDMDRHRKIISGTQPEAN